jgi:predicted HicB family RNase H-like nuclease
MTTMTHKGYIASIELDEEAGIFSGLVLNAPNATLHFEGQNAKDLHKAFAGTVADYEAWCIERGKRPEKPYSGKLALRLAPALHYRVAAAAAKAGRSINTFIADTLERLA